MARRERLLERRTRAIAEAQACQSKIDRINDELSLLTVADEDRFTRLRAIIGIRIED